MKARFLTGTYTFQSNRARFNQFKVNPNVQKIILKPENIFLVICETLKAIRTPYLNKVKKGKRKVQGVLQSQTAALPRPQEEEETDKSKQAQTEQTYEKH